jgi:hypothetical protein
VLSDRGFGVLTMEADRVERATFLDCHDPACSFEVMLRFANPLPEYFNNLRRNAHRGLCLHAKLASTRCSPRFGSVRNGNWSKQGCPWGRAIRTRVAPGPRAEQNDLVRGELLCNSPNHIVQTWLAFGDFAHGTHDNPHPHFQRRGVSCNQEEHTSCRVHHFSSSSW